MQGVLHPPKEIILTIGSKQVPDVDARSFGFRVRGLGFWNPVLSDDFDAQTGRNVQSQDHEGLDRRVLGLGLRVPGCRKLVFEFQAPQTLKSQTEALQSEL